MGEHGGGHGGGHALFAYGLMGRCWFLESGSRGEAHPELSQYEYDVGAIHTFEWR